MDIVKLWQNIANNYNKNIKCGFCWNFGAPLTESAMNVQQNSNLNKC